MKKVFILVIVLLVFTIGCTSKKEKIIIYSSNEEAVDQMLKEKFDKKFKDFDVVIQYYSTGNNAAKIKSEGEKTEADIVIGLETAQLQGLTDNFETLDYIDKSVYNENVNPDNNKYVIDVQYSASVIVDKSYFKKHNLDMPTSYKDLLSPKFKNLIAIPNPKTSGTGYMFYLNAINVMGEKKALEYFKKLENNVFKYTESGSGPLSLLKQGEVPIAVGLTYQAVQENNNGADYEIIELDTGALYNSCGAAIIKGKANEHVKEVFQYYVSYLIKDIVEQYSPSNILKNVNGKVKGYPEIKKLADMTGIYDNNVKQKYLKLWEY